jgi:DNA repair protein SbcC/Rad50
VISHVPTVAERIDAVLEVRLDVDGSTIDLLSGQEVEERVSEALAMTTAAL